MPNQKYDHTSTIMTGTEWVNGRVYAFLYDGATFDATDKILSDVTAGGATQVNVTEIMNKTVGPKGEAQGLSAAFRVTPKGSPYQVILALGKPALQVEYPVLCFYEEDEDGNDIGLQNNGTLIVRPQDFDQPTGRGTWFTL